MKNIKNIQIKVWLMYSSMFLVGIAIAFKMFAVQFFAEEAWKEEAKEAAVQAREIQPNRGQIFSSDKLLLATTISEFEIRWDSKVPNLEDEDLTKYIDSASYTLATMFPKNTKEEYRKKFRKALSENNSYARIVKDVDFLQKKEIQKSPFFNLGRFKSGIIFEEIKERKHPLGKLAERTIGIHRDNEQVGLERAYDEELSGKPGQRLEEKLAGGTWKPVSDDYLIEPIEGADVISSINSEIQDVATTSLETILTDNDCEWGVAIVMEVETGYVKAMTNLAKTQNKEGVVSYRETKNFGILERTEPGSTFKLPSLLAALDDGLIHLNDSVKTGNGVAKFYDKVMKDSDWKYGGYGTISIQQAFEKSSNIGCALALQRAYKANPQEYLNKLKSFGLYNSLSLNFSGENPPIMKSLTSQKGWSGVSLTQMAIGYELQCSPLQTLSFYNAIANNGKFMQPLFAEALSRRGEIFQVIEPKVIHDGFIKDETIEIAKTLLQGVVENGTAKKVIKNDKYTAAGKTGTAWAAVNGSYKEKKYQASFCGYFPAEKPKYSCIVVVFNPQSGKYYGSALAAPVFKDIADAMYTKQYFSSDIKDEKEISAKVPLSKDGSQYELRSVYDFLGMNFYSDSPDAEWVITKTNYESVRLETKTDVKEKMPYVVGMGLNDALYLLESRGLYVKFNGHGTVTKQSVKSGASLENTSVVTLEMSLKN